MTGYIERVRKQKQGNEDKAMTRQQDSQQSQQMTAQAKSDFPPDTYSNERWDKWVQLQSKLSKRCVDILIKQKDALDAFNGLIIGMYQIGLTEEAMELSHDHGDALKRIYNRFPNLNSIDLYDIYECEWFNTHDEFMQTAKDIIEYSAEMDKMVEAFEDDFTDDDLIEMQRSHDQYLYDECYAAF